MNSQRADPLHQRENVLIDTPRRVVPDMTPSLCRPPSPCSHLNDDAHKGIGTASLRPVECEAVFEPCSHHPSFQKPYLKHMEFGIVEWSLLKWRTHPNNTVHDLSEENWERWNIRYPPGPYNLPGPPVALFLPGSAPLSAPLTGFESVPRAALPRPRPRPSTSSSATPRQGPRLLKRQAPPRRHPRRVTAPTSSKTCPPPFPMDICLPTPRPTTPPTSPEPTPMSFCSPPPPPQLASLPSPAPLSPMSPLPLSSSLAPWSPLPPPTPPQQSASSSSFSSSLAPWSPLPLPTPPQQPAPSSSSSSSLSLWSPLPPPTPPQQAAASPDADAASPLFSSPLAPWSPLPPPTPSPSSSPLSPWSPLPPPTPPQQPAFTIPDAAAAPQPPPLSPPESPPDSWLEELREMGEYNGPNYVERMAISLGISVEEAVSKHGHWIIGMKI
ncbi:hypothetical protein BDV97DRAFT_365907 [Delphinella strobiligena]|nr:hypothetical protein BDV97DRAFT_365907 [Delphinella strobiligena]